MIERVLRAVQLDADFYRETHADDSRTGEAFIVAIVAGLIAGGLTGLFGGGLGEFVGGFAAGAIGASLGLLIGGGILLLIGRLFGGSAQYMGLVRTLGYASAPNALGWIPVVGFLASIWSLVCAVIAVRESHSVSTGIAIVIVLIPAVILGILFAILAAVFFAALFAAFS